MADAKISALPSATTPVGTEVLPLVQSGVTTKITINAATGITRPFTANGVVYASSTTAQATGSALTFDGSTLFTTGLSNSGNLTFTGTGNRITGDFSNSTVTNRVAFETSTTNGGTFLSAFPNGTSTQSGISFNNANSSTADRSNLTILANTSLDVSFRSNIVGSGTYLPMTFYTGGAERIRILGGTSANVGNVGIGTSTPDATALLDVQSTTKGVRMPNMTTTQKNAISSPAAGLIVFDTTLAKLCVYSGAAWQTITSV